MQHGIVKVRALYNVPGESIQEGLEDHRLAGEAMLSCYDPEDTFDVYEPPHCEGDDLDFEEFCFTHGRRVETVESDEDPHKNQDGDTDWPENDDFDHLDRWFESQGDEMTEDRNQWQEGDVRDVHPDFFSQEDEDRMVRELAEVTSRERYKKIWRFAFIMIVGFAVAVVAGLLVAGC